VTDIQYNSSQWIKWKRITAPGPLPFQAKLQIAQYLEYSGQALRRLDHMAAHPKDLYLLPVSDYLNFTTADLCWIRVNVLCYIRSNCLALLLLALLVSLLASDSASSP